MGTFAGTRAFNGEGNLPLFADTRKGKHVILIAVLAVLVVKVRAQKMAGVVIHDGINPYHIPSILVFSRQMLVEVFISKRRELAVWTFRTLELLLVAELAIPFIAANRLVTCFPSCPAVPPSGKNILTTLEQTTEQFNLFQRRECQHG